jgi:esterase/lipase superfamily enzyme
MISLRDRGGIGTNRNVDGPTYWVSDNEAIDDIKNWERLGFDRFKSQLVAVWNAFPHLPRNSHEEQRHTVLAVHGYANGWTRSIHWYKHLNNELFCGADSMGICILLTWPSASELYDSLTARQELCMCADDICNILGDLSDRIARIQAKNVSWNEFNAKISMIAHGTGNFLVQVGFWYLWKRNNPWLATRLINQLLMIAADVDNDIFGSRDTAGDTGGAGIANLSYRVTALYSGRDPILSASAASRHFSKRRLGRSGLDRTAAPGHPGAPDNVWDTDCTQFLTNVGTSDVHFGYFGVPELIELIRQVLRGVDRRILVSEGRASQDSWWSHKD